MKILSLLISLSTVSLLFGNNVDSTQPEDTCKPSFYDIYNFEVGDVFQYRHTSSKSAGGNNSISDVVSQYKIHSLFRKDNQVTYFITGWKQTYAYKDNIGFQEDRDTVYTEEFIDTSMVYIDSSDHLLNHCPKELVLLQNTLVNQVSLDEYYTYVQTFISDSTYITDSTLSKVVGGEGNLHQYQADSLVPVTDVLYEAIYQEGLGLTNMRFSFFDIEEQIVLEGYLHGSDTIGELSEGTYPDIAATNIETRKKTEHNVLFPNPSNGIISLKSPESIKLFSVYSINGNILFSSLQQNTYIDLSHLGAGMYIVNLEFLDGSHQSEKLFIF